MKRTKPKKQITTLEPLMRPFNILSKIGKARTLDKRVTVTGDGADLILSASLEKDTPKFGGFGLMPGKVWLSYRAPGEGGLTRELGIEPRLFKVALGSGKGITLEVKLIVEKNRLVPRAMITDSDGVTTECPVLDSDGVCKAPKVEGHHWGTAPVEELSGAFSWSYRAVSVDSGRPHLNSILLTSRRVIGTDGHRLHVGPLPFDVGFDSLLYLEGVRALLEIFKLEGNKAFVKVTGNDRAMLFEIGPWSVTFQFPDACFPPYTKVIPSPWDRPGGLRVTADSGKLLKAMKKAQTVLKGDHLKCVRITPRPELIEIAAENATDDLTVNMTVPGSTVGNPGFLFGANVEYVADALLDSGDVEIFIGPEGKNGAGHTTDAAVFSVGEDQFAVVMPMRM